MRISSFARSGFSMKCLFFSIGCFLFLFFFAPRFFSVQADELSEIEKKLADLEHALQLSVDATTPLEKDLGKLQATLTSIQGQIRGIEQDMKEKERQVEEGETLLVIAQELLNRKVRRMYKTFSTFPGSGVSLFFEHNLPLALRRFGYQKAVIASDRDTIVTVVLYVKDLEKKKEELTREKLQLAHVKATIDTQAAFLAKEISGAKKYQAALAQTIAQLSARQKQLLAEKLASLNLPTSLGAGPLYCVDDRKIDPGFGSGYAFFTYGIPHRVGMNQYGALGRAKAGQSYQDILRAYYDGIQFEKRDPNMKIHVQGWGEKSLDDYLLGVYEMPGDWPMDALKAQVVAARSYALSYTQNGQREICTTQACQVYKGGNKGGNWERAVKETAGEVMVRDGAVITAWYASTFGGYAFTSADVWGNHRSWTKRFRDTEGDVSSFRDLSERSYDRESPCFYAAQGLRQEYGKSAWLKEGEVADIVNVLLLAKKDGGVQKHLAQTDKPNPDGEETWDAERVKRELYQRGERPFSSLREVRVEWDMNVGKTSRVSVSGDAGSTLFDGSEFHDYFNLRAPANIQIVGPLYTVETR